MSVEVLAHALVMYLTALQRMSGFRAFKAQVPIQWSESLYITLVRGLPGSLWCGMFQVFNEISSREMEEIDVFKGILDNYVFVVVIGATVFFQIIIIEFLGTFASTTPLTLVQ